MTSLHIPIIGGTGYFDRLGPVPLPIPYYERLRRVAAKHTDHAHVVSLYGGGVFVGPKTRSIRTTREITARHESIGEAWGVYFGHSQGGNQAVASGLWNHRRVRGVVAYSPVLNGHPGAAKCKLPIFGVLGMRPGSGNLLQMLWQQQVLARQFRQGKIEFIPELHLVSSEHDGIVSCESAHTVHPDYPNVFHYCMSDDPNHRCHPDVQIIPASRRDSHHIRMVRTRPGLTLAESIIAGVRARLENAA